jgi:hypothetical protein
MQKHDCRVWRNRGVNWESLLGYSEGLTRAGLSKEGDETGITAEIL